MAIARLAAVMDQHPPARAPGIARALAVLMLLAGIVAMHSAVFGTAHASDSAHGSAPEVAPSDHSDPRVSAAPTGDHAAVLAPAPADHSALDIGVPTEPAPIDSTHPIAAPSDPNTGCGAAGCDEHTAVHACVFVLAALAIALTLVLLYRLGDTAEAARRTPRIWRGRRMRPPPWTVLTLSQLAILRI
ncbi:hypothetical protein ACTWPB_12035 [Nocardia sp. IBHARD005]|uniref:hypothetical protein n=1 Tax=Nocardia sp. IBHARD005 TaxID=3457765 RepID=UPI0040593FA5